MIDAMPPQVETVREPQSTVFSWPCHPSAREAVFEVCEQGRSVRVTLDTDRTWWALVDGSQASEPVWQSSRIQLTPDHCAPVSEAELLIRFSRSTAVDASIGFQLEDRRAIQISSSGQASIHLHGFSDVRDLRSFGAHQLKLWVYKNENEFEVIVANVDILMKCPWCEARMSEKGEMFGHLLNEHHERCFERLNLRGEGINNVTGPSTIFVCLEPQCGQYYPASSLPGEYPIDRLSRHANERHPNRMAYKKIDNPQDIRNLLGLKEKWVWKCNIGTCRPITPSSDDEDALSDKKAHLREEHFSDLFAGLGEGN
jgi:hypothetical protein